MLNMLRLCKAILEIPDDEPVEIVGSSSTPLFKKKKFNVMERVYKNMEGCDFALVFDGAEVPCHKMILASTSRHSIILINRQYVSPNYQTVLDLVAAVHAIDS